MKSWSGLCFLVLVMSSVSRGQDKTTKEAVPTPPPLPGENPHAAAATGTTPSTAPPTTPSPQNKSSANATDVPSTVFTTQEEETQSTDDLVNKTTEEVNGSSAAAQTTKTPSVSATQSRRDVGDGVTTTTTTSTTTTTTASTSSTLAPTGGSSHPSWGYVVLALIFIVIIVLCVILFFLRRVSRTYSFDLHRQAPANHFNEPTGTFEQVYLDDLEQPASKDQVTTDDLSPPPVSNGTTLQSEERGSNGDSAPAPATQEPLDATGQAETSPTSNTTSPSLGDDPADQTPSPLSSSTNLFFDVIGEEQQNENNNNPSVRSSDPFVDINLDEPVWCNQLLTSPEDSSSVLPFSPFSFSSSSSSSSSS